MLISKTQSSESNKDTSMALAKPSAAMLVPQIAAWTVQRPFQSHAHVIRGGSEFESKDSDAVIGSFPLQVQEQLVLDDLLSCFTGISGRHVKMMPKAGTTNDVVFQFDPTLDYSMADLASRMTPLAHYYIQITDFIEEHSRPEHGLVNHALCSALRALIKEFLIRIAQLEHQFLLGQLDLQKLWYYLLPHTRKMQVLHSLVNAVAEAGNPRGGALINIIYNQSHSVGGDERVHQLFLYLLEKACAPFLKMVSDWVYRGYLDDIYAEFMIEEREYKKWHNDTYWSKRYSLKEDKTPHFLRGFVAEQILVTGKYLNVIRECGQDVVCPDTQQIDYADNDRIFAQKIQVAYDFASARLLHLLIKEKNLMGHLKTLKRYFLLEQGDWLVYFVDSASADLALPISEIQLSNIESTLEHAIKSSSSGIPEELRANIHCELMTQTALEEVLHVISIDGSDSIKATPHEYSSTGPRSRQRMTGLEAFALTYTAEWPLSLVLSGKTLTKYRWMFRHLFTYKHVEQSLCRAWSCHQSTKSIDVQAAFMASYSLRRRMLHFIQSLQHYLVFDVIEKNWSQFENKFKKASSIDEVLSLHDHFLDNCITQFMLNDVNLIRSLARLMSSCLRFVEHVENISRSFDLKPDDTISNKDLSAKERRRKQQSRIKVVTDNARMSASDEHYRQTVAKKEKEFDEEIRGLLSTLSSLPKSGNDVHMELLCNQLDYNGFYIGSTVSS